MKSTVCPATIQAVDVRSTAISTQRSCFLQGMCNSWCSSSVPTGRKDRNSKCQLAFFHRFLLVKLQTFHCILAGSGLFLSMFEHSNYLNTHKIPESKSKFLGSTDSKQFLQAMRSTGGAFKKAGVIVKRKRQKYLRQPERLSEIQLQKLFWRPFTVPKLNFHTWLHISTHYSNSLQSIERHFPS